MAENCDIQNIDVKYYYNKKNKYFEEILKDRSLCGKISVKEFLKCLSVAYQTNKIKEGEQFEHSFNNNYIDWKTITRSELFSDLLDIDEPTLYSVIEEIMDLSKLNVNKEFEVYSYCDYLFSIPSNTNLTLSSNNSSENSLNCPVADVNFEMENTLKHNSPEQMLNEKAENFCTKKKMCKQAKYSRGTSREKSKIKSYRFQQENTPSEYLDISLFTNEDIPTNIQRSHNLLTDDNILASKDQDEIIIHVIDDSNNMTKDFCCSQKLLASHMGYFAELLGNKNLSSEINIHCDVDVFEFVMEWLKQGVPFDELDTESQSKISFINSTNVVKILISASFLQIEPLINLCLSFCKSNINKVIKSSQTFSCLNNNILNRLSGMFSNVDVEMIKDKNDIIRSFLYCKLIMSLVSPEPEPWKGHFSSLATMFKCIHCKKLVLQKIAVTIPCLEANMHLNSRGKVVNVHTRDYEWNMTDFIQMLRRELRCWRKVYWHLWAQCHFLYCTSCNTHYGILAHKKCFYHPKEPQFLTTRKRSDLQLAGVYPCCGAKAYRYQCVFYPEKGCETKNHTPLLKNNRASSDIMKLFELYQPLMTSNQTQSSTVYSTNLKGKFPKTKKSCNVKDLVMKVAENIVRMTTMSVTNHNRKGLLDVGITTQPLVWIRKENKIIDNITTHSSDRLFSSANEKKPKGTLVGMILQAESKKRGFEVIDYKSEESFSESDSESSSTQSNLDEDEICDTDKPWSTIQKIYSQKSTRPHLSTKRYKFNFSVRVNQDNQRTYEQHTLISINEMLTNKILGRSIFSNKFDNINSLTQSFHKKFGKRMILQTNDSIIHSSVSSTSVGSRLSNNSLSSDVSTIDSTVRINHSRVSSVWNSHTPLAGNYVKIESEWRNTNNLSLQMYSSNYSSSRTACRPVNNQSKLFSRQLQKIHKKSKYTCVTKRQKDYPQYTCSIEDENRIWVFDGRSQELDYLSAVYKPVSSRKEFKNNRQHIPLDWNSLIRLEKYWNAFLSQFSENECLPNEEDVKMCAKLDLSDNLKDLYKTIHSKLLNRNRSNH